MVNIDGDLKVLGTLVHEPLGDMFADCGLGEPKDLDYLSLALIALIINGDCQEAFHGERPVISEDTFIDLVDTYNDFFDREEVKRIIMKHNNLTDEKLATIIFIACTLVYGNYIDAEMEPARETPNESLSMMYA